MEPTNRAENPVAGVAETAAAPPARSSPERGRRPYGARAASTDGAARVELGEAPPVAFPLRPWPDRRCLAVRLGPSALSLTRPLPRSPPPVPVAVAVPVPTSTQPFPIPPRSGTARRFVSHSHEATTQSAPPVPSLPRRPLRSCDEWRSTTAHCALSSEASSPPLHHLRLLPPPR